VLQLCWELGAGENGLLKPVQSAAARDEDGHCMPAISASRSATSPPAACCCRPQQRTAGALPIGGGAGSRVPDRSSPRSRR
jgi:hypothetical protein